MHVLRLLGAGKPGKNFRVGIYTFELKLVRVGLQESNNYF